MIRYRRAIGAAATLLLLELQAVRHWMIRVTGRSASIIRTPGSSIRLTVSGGRKFKSGSRWHRHRRNRCERTVIIRWHLVMPAAAIIDVTE